MFTTKDAPTRTWNAARAMVCVVEKGERERGDKEGTKRGARAQRHSKTAADATIVMQRTRRLSDWQNLPRAWGLDLQGCCFECCFLSCWQGIVIVCSPPPKHTYTHQACWVCTLSARSCLPPPPSLPAPLPPFPRTKHSHNKLGGLPSSIAELPKLSTLIASYNPDLVSMAAKLSALSGLSDLRGVCGVGKRWLLGRDGEVLWRSKNARALGWVWQRSRKTAISAQYSSRNTSNS